MKDRSLFFPLAFIAAGVLWILIDMGKIPAENLWALAHFWPFLLIAAGLGLMLRSYWPPVRAIFDVLVVGAAVLAVVFAPQLGWTTPQWNLGFNTSFQGSVPGSGKWVSENRPVSGFQTIDISYPAEILIKQGQAESLSIEADDNLLPQLRSHVSGGTLTIENGERDWAKRVNPSRTVKVIITVKDLREVDFSSAGTLRIENLETNGLSVSVSGAGDVRLENLKTQKLECHLSGVGSVTANGAADELLLQISGVGNFKGADLLSKGVDAHISGTGSATVHAEDKLNAEISGTGSIRYYGSPSITQNVSGLGSVNKIDE
jgi:hypothetical protein